MTVATDQRSQKMAALALADEVRSWRKHLKEDLKTGRVLFAECLLSDAAHLQTMKVYKLLRATPVIGKVKARRALLLCRISPAAAVGGLTRERREELLDFLAEKHIRADLGWKVTK